MRPILPLLAIAFLLASCHYKADVKNQYYRRITSEGTSYIYFSEKKYAQAFDNGSQVVQVSKGNYAVHDRLTLYDFSYYDRELSNIFKGSRPEKAECMMSPSTIYFSPDSPDVDYKKISQTDIPYYVLRQLQR
jgi:hypothetical protein